MKRRSKKEVENKEKNGERMERMKRMKRMKIKRMKTIKRRGRARTPLAWRVEDSASTSTWQDSSLFLSILIFISLTSSAPTRTQTDAKRFDSEKIK